MTYYHPTVLSECDSVTWSSVIHSACREVRGEKVVDWDTAALNVTDLQVEEVERGEICSAITRTDQLMAFDESKTFDEIRKFCSSVGGQFAVARDNSSFWEISEIFNQTCSKYELSFFYSGYSDREQHGTWRDVNTGQEMSWDNWLEEYPTSYTSDDCTYGDLTDGQVYNADCNSKGRDHFIIKITFLDSELRNIQTVSGAN